MIMFVQLYLQNQPLKWQVLNKSSCNSCTVHPVFLTKALN